METFAVFLRGVNVGGKTSVKMSELKTILSENNYQEVQPYINSGNIVLKSDLKLDEVKRNISELVYLKYNLKVDLIVKTKNEIEYILMNDPFILKDKIDKSKKCVAMLSGKPAEDQIKNIELANDIKEAYFFNINLLYVYYDKGQSKTKLTNSFIEKNLKVTSTIRNWNTIEKIYEMMA